MRIDLATLHDALAKLTTPLDWYRASEIVNSSLGWWAAAYNAIVEALARASEFPVAGPIAFSVLMNVVVWLGVAMGVLAGLSVFVVMLVSQWISGMLGMFLDAATDVLALVERAARIFGGA